MKPRRLSFREREIWLDGLTAGLRSAGRALEAAWRKEIAMRQVNLSLDSGNVSVPPDEWPSGPKKATGQGASR